MDDNYEVESESLIKYGAFCPRLCWPCDNIELIHEWVWQVSVGSELDMRGPRVGSRLS